MVGKVCESAESRDRQDFGVPFGKKIPQKAHKINYADVVN